MKTLIPADRRFLGLIELDAAGTVLYSKIEGGGDESGAMPDVAGKNFYIEVAGFTNVEDFRRHLDIFAKSHSSADRFDFTCDYEGDSVPVRVLLARIRERANNQLTKSILVYIKQA